MSNLTYGQLREANKPNLHVFGMWKEARVLEGTTHRQGENMMQSPHRNLNPESFCCEATALTTTVQPTQKQVFLQKCLQIQIRTQI